ncbi:MAG: peptide chain release factor N(5)-glutamine methyltransferase [Bauldia sp.]|nr:peptide chain release factor N(5)-glutamine methyltransferase [Bauldia sp.]
MSPTPPSSPRRRPGSSATRKASQAALDSGFRRNDDGVQGQALATSDQPDTTIAELRRAVAAELRAAWGDDPAQSPQLDAKLIVAHALGRDPGGLVFHDKHPVDATNILAVRDLVRRRLAGEPVARLVGEREFWGLPFALGPDTLVPRPDSETVVAALLEALGRTGPRARPLRLLDLGTGSGCLLLAALSELPDAFGVGVDLAEGAVMVARSNAARLGLAARSAFVRGSWAESLSGRFDGILANPPYIESEAIDSLAIEVREHDPKLALDGGPDGLAPYRAMIPELPCLLAADGAAVFEIGMGQAGSVAAIAGAAGLNTFATNDLSGLPRALTMTLRN